MSSKNVGNSVIGDMCPINQNQQLPDFKNLSDPLSSEVSQAKLKVFAETLVSQGFTANSVCHSMIKAALALSFDHDITDDFLEKSHAQVSRYTDSYCSQAEQGSD